MAARTTTSQMGKVPIAVMEALRADTPFTTMFAMQISLSELPFPSLSRWSGQLGEMTAGAVLLTLFFFGSWIAPVIAGKVFYLANLMIAVIMMVAVYVHVHPEVPAEVLPFGTKPPFSGTGDHVPRLPEHLPAPEVSARSG